MKILFKFLLKNPIPSVFFITFVFIISSIMLIINGYITPSKADAGRYTPVVEITKTKKEDTIISSEKVVDLTTQSVIDNPSTEKPKEEETEQTKSKYLDKWFGAKTGKMHWDVCQSTATGRKFTDAFAEFGQDAQVIACVTLNNENGIVGADYITDAVSPCWSTNPAQAKARKCDYASDNGKGVDAGLFMINTYHQSQPNRKFSGGRIASLGGPTCNKFVDSRDPQDPCNIQLIDWLHNIDNQIAIIKNIYAEQGFGPWNAYRDKVEPYIK